MRAANYEVCLLASPVREVKERLRLQLSPLRGLRHELLDCVEGHYSDAQDSLLLRLRFSALVGEPTLQRQLTSHLRELGLDVIVPQKLSQKQRQEFEMLLESQEGVRLHVYPSATVPFAISQIFDTLDAHFESSRPARRLTTEIDCEPTRMERSSTIDALDHIIEESPDQDVDAMDSVIASLPLRLETFGPLDEMIANLSERPKTHDSLDAILDDLWP